MRAEKARVPAACAAVGQAAHDVLAHLFKDDAAAIDTALSGFNFLLSSIIADSELLSSGRDWGAQVAKGVIADRANDGAFSNPVFTVWNDVDFPSGAFQHRPDPTAADAENIPQTMYGVHWGKVKPFGHNTLPDVLKNPLKLPYKRDFIEVKAYGEKVSAVRTEAMTHVGIFWACALPPHALSLPNTSLTPASCIPHCFESVPTVTTARVPPVTAPAAPAFCAQPPAAALVATGVLLCCDPL